MTSRPEKDSFADPTPEHLSLERKIERAVMWYDMDAARHLMQQAPLDETFRQNLLGTLSKLGDYPDMWRFIIEDLKTEVDPVRMALLFNMTCSKNLRGTSVYLATRSLAQGEHPLEVHGTLARHFPHTKICDMAEEIAAVTGDKQDVLSEMLLSLFAVKSVDDAGRDIVQPINFRESGYASFRSEVCGLLVDAGAAPRTRQEARIMLDLFGFLAMAGYDHLALCPDRDSDRYKKISGRMNGLYRTLIDLCKPHMRALDDYTSIFFTLFDPMGGDLRDIMAYMMAAGADPFLVGKAYFSVGDPSGGFDPKDRPPGWTESDEEQRRERKKESLARLQAALDAHTQASSDLFSAAYPKGFTVADLRCVPQVDGNHRKESGLVIAARARRLPDVLRQARAEGFSLTAEDIFACPDADGKSALSVALSRGDIGVLADASYWLAADPQVLVKAHAVMTADERAHTDYHAAVAALDTARLRAGGKGLKLKPRGPGA